MSTVEVGDMAPVRSISEAVCQRRRCPKGMLTQMDRGRDAPVTVPVRGLPPPLSW